MAPLIEVGTRELAEHLGVSTDWVLNHAQTLGGVKTKRGRVRWVFDLEEAKEKFGDIYMMGMGR